MCIRDRLLIGVFVLAWSMNGHLKKARDHFAATEDGPATGGTQSVEGGGPAASRRPPDEHGG